MDYGRFVRTRQPLWDEFEQATRTRARTAARSITTALETLAFRYRQVLHDHALAAARYPETGSARRLWRLALEGTQWLQRDRGRTHRRRGALLHARVFPRAMRRLGPHLSVATRPVRVVRPDRAQPGDRAAGDGRGLPRARRDGGSARGAAVDGGAHHHGAAGRLVVARSRPTTWASPSLAWAGGALAGLGALWVVLLNGFMLGAIVGATLPYAMTGRLLEFVAAHGPLELTLIVVSAGGGPGHGPALVAASDRPRREVVREAARRSLVVLGGCLPWFVLLGARRGLISPAPDVAPDAQGRARRRRCGCCSSCSPGTLSCGRT